MLKLEHCCSKWKGASPDHGEGLQELAWLMESWCQLQRPDGLGSCTHYSRKLGDVMKTSDCVSDESLRPLGKEWNNKCPACSHEFATQSLTKCFPYVFS